MKTFCDLSRIKVRFLDNLLLPKRHPNMKVCGSATDEGAAAGGAEEAGPKGKACQGEGKEGKKRVEKQEMEKEGRGRKECTK